MDTKVDTKIGSTQQQNQVYQNEAEFGVHSPGRRAKVSLPARLRLAVQITESLRMFGLLRIWWTVLRSAEFRLIIADISDTRVYWMGRHLGGLVGPQQVYRRALSGTGKNTL